MDKAMKEKKMLFIVKGSDCGWSRGLCQPHASLSRETHHMHADTLSPSTVKHTYPEVSSSYSFLSCGTKHSKQCLHPFGDKAHHPYVQGSGNMAAEL